MSVTLFGLAVKKVNGSERIATISLSNGYVIKDIVELGAVKRQAGFGYAKHKTGGYHGYCYFNIKDFVSFEVDEDVGEEANEPQPEED